ncbi:MAG: SUMF1/EgtB/PvdO family nonheme iron enzyme [Acidiferrobacter sp.]
MDETRYRLLQKTRTKALALVAAVPDEDGRRMHHKELSPLLWHVWHLLYMEQHWIGERLVGGIPSRERARLFRPDGLKKTERGAFMPDLATLTREWNDWDGYCASLLASALRDRPTDPLVRDDYILHFLIQHHSQHIETMRQILLARTLQKDHGEFEVSKPLMPRRLHCSYQPWSGGHSSIGHGAGPEPYDNERPQHTVSLPAFAIAERPVSNAEYLRFIEDGGYRTENYWSQEGWGWRRYTNAQAPWHWRQNTRGLWYGVDLQGPYALPAADPVFGISAYEACALARYAKARLPTEQEWETAACAGLLHQVGHAWEWCANRFYPYPEFRAFPYRGYSMPWFDGVHTSLRGSSAYSEEPIRRRTFRNFHTANKRHIFAGVRLCRYYHS